MVSSQRNIPRKRVQAYAALSVVPLSLVGLGGIPLWTMVLVGAVLVVCLLLGRGRWQLPTQWPPSVMGILLVLTAYTLLQALPMPIGVLKALSPAAADVHEFALRPLGEVRSWGSISLDRGATLIEALRLAIYAACFFLAARVARRYGRKSVAQVVCVSSLFLLLATGAHTLLGANKVWGVHEPSFDNARAIVGPLLNANNLAGYLNLGAFCGLGVAIGSERFAARNTWLAIAAVLLSAMVSLGSRGAVGAAVIGAVCFYLLRRSSVRGGLANPTERRAMLGVLAISTILVGIGIRGQTLSALFDDDLTKLRGAYLIWPALADFGWLGFGRGAFESAFAAYSVPQGNTIYSHPENLPAQWISEWGIPIGVLALVAFSWCLNPRALGATHHPVAAGMWAGGLVVAIQNQVDLSSEVPAVPIAFFVCAGACWGAESRTRSTKSVDAGWATPLAAVLVATLLCSIAWAGPTVGADRRELFGSWDANSLGESMATREALRAAMLRHPAEPYFALLGAELALRRRDVSPIPWLQRALTLGPKHGRSHLLLARALHGRGAHRQALLELRLAAQYDPQLAGFAAQQAFQTTQDPEELLRAVPDGSDGVGVLEALVAEARSRNERELAIQLASRTVARAPKSLEPRNTLARLLLEECESQPSRCAVERFQAETSAMASLPGGTHPAALLRARHLVLSGDNAAASRVFSTTCSVAKDRDACFRAWIRAASFVAGGDELAEATGAYIAHACVRTRPCAAAHDLVASTRLRRGEINIAIGHFQKAVDQEPTAARWTRLAQVAEKGEQPGLAARAYARARALETDGVSLKRGQDRLRPQVLP